MKTKMNYILSIVTLLMTFTLVDCGSNSGSSTTAATPAIGASCTVGNMSGYQTTAGCLQSCGASMVYYQSQCVSVTSLGVSTFGTNGSSSICQTGCPAGYTMVGNQCFQQYTCGPCYGTPDGVTCYMGNYAHQYYGY